jgi:hypothetical protein
MDLRSVVSPMALRATTMTIVHRPPSMKTAS